MYACACSLATSCSYVAAIKGPVEERRVMSVKLIFFRRLSDPEYISPSTGRSRENLILDANSDHGQNTKDCSVKPSVLHAGLHRVQRCCNYRRGLLWSCAVQSVIILFVISAMSFPLVAFYRYSPPENEHLNMVSLAMCHYTMVLGTVIITYKV